MAKPRPPLPRSCAECVFHRGDPGDKTNPSRCLRHAPGTRDEEYQPVQWPPPPSTFRCGAGAVAGDHEDEDEDAPRMVNCRDCEHWFQPDGAPLKPTVRHGLPQEWWDRSGYCTRWAPSPSGQDVRRLHHGVTNSSQGCGDGVPLEAEEEVEDGGLLAAAPS